MKWFNCLSILKQTSKANTEINYLIGLCLNFKFAL